MRDLAWHLHSRRGRTLPKEECLRLVAGLLSDFSRSDLTPEQVLQLLSHGQGLLREQDDGHYAFVHFTFQEYFVAQYIKEFRDETLVLHSLGDPWWEEVTLLYAGAIPDASTLLARLLASDDQGRSLEDVFLSKLILAGRCLAERPRVSKPGLRQQVIGRLCTQFLLTEFQFTRRHLANTLAEIGRAAPAESAPDGASSLNQWLLTHLRETTGPFAPSPDLQRAILRALGNYGSPSLVGALIDLLIQSVNANNADIYAIVDTAIERLAQPEETLFLRLLTLVRDPQAQPALAMRAAYLLAVTGTARSASMLLTDLTHTNLANVVRGGLAYSCALLSNTATV
ncbi:MAG: NACHT domain-containing protein, partial [Ktedonobacteraceae bacterium]